MQVIIADPDHAALEVLRNTLQTEGHEVSVAVTGQEILDVLRLGLSHLVISTWKLPGKMTGAELCQAIRGGDFGGYVYVMMIGGTDATRDDRVQCLQAGGNDFFCKPVDPIELSARLRGAERILSLESRDQTIFALAKLTESRDPDTGTHIERVQNYSRVLADKLVTNCKSGAHTKPGFANLIYQTSPLHDIGKVAIPDRVLLKPGTLSTEEFEVMKRHTTLGAQALESAARKNPSAEFLRTAIEIAMSHHEKWDGSGYPNKLRARQIPLSARIVALADVYDALTSKRVYKKAMPHGAARAIIESASGAHFDPTVVDVFKSCEAHFVAIRERFGTETAKRDHASTIAA